MVQLITSIFLLRSNQVAVLKTSLIGSILSNLLLMSGLSFFFGGINRVYQYFNGLIVQALMSMLLLVTMGLLIPTASQFLVQMDHAGILKQSRGTAVLLIFSYALWLYYELRTHASVISHEMEGSASRKTDLMQSKAKTFEDSKEETKRTDEPTEEEEEQEEEVMPELMFWVVVVVLAVFITLLAFNVQFASDSIDSVLQDAGLSATFLGIVIVPLLNNDPTVIVVAVKDRMDLSIGLTVGKCIQTALCVTPLTVLIAWSMGMDEMTLLFGGFEVSAVFAAVLIVSHVVDKGRSDWLQGAFLIQAFIMLAVASYFVA